ncbi:hypothetical protein AVEN_191816-1 [Araneus ventricosus]|uniref:Uncharacterized protein n=1 Tax=Araneus ventricosus TaxID=182803 RepID=A0A4Y2NTU3_ARAVE|nr:hypothetical protein AVEN_191816-1 [Araneus ventricosus]
MLVDDALRDAAKDSSPTTTRKIASLPPQKSPMQSSSTRDSKAESTTHYGFTSCVEAATMLDQPARTLQIFSYRNGFLVLAYPMSLLSTEKPKYDEAVIGEAGAY